jgi:hypothetical protein
MELNNTQNHLLDEQYNDRIGPCIKEILALAKSTRSKEVCVYLILMALQGTLDDRHYRNLLTDYLGEKKQSWLEERLISLNKLFQPNNSDHLFIKFIIDKRFYSNNLEISQDRWVSLCKNLVTNEYSSRIHAEISRLYPTIYKQVWSEIKPSIKESNSLTCILI